MVGTAAVYLTFVSRVFLVRPISANGVHHLARIFARGDIASFLARGRYTLTILPVSNSWYPPLTPFNDPAKFEFQSNFIFPRARAPVLILAAREKVDLKKTTVDLKISFTDTQTQPTAKIEGWLVQRNRMKKGKRGSQRVPASSIPQVDL